ncbi:CYP63 cytochrome P450 monooxygenase-like protein [Lyophyllum atratum]|nr:CYP63 cytochrome P450 monooxygenase-like protein [Lyophyllum atratum]
MVRITPGLDLLRRNLQVPVVSVCFIFVLGRWLELRLPTWTSFPLLFSVFLLYILVKIVSRKCVEASNAALVGARPMSSAAGCRIPPGHAGPHGSRIWKLLQEYGPVLVGSNTILTTSLEHIKIILSTNPDNYAKDESLHEAMGLVLGSGIFSCPDDMWKFHRTITRPFFNRNRVAHLQLFARHTQHIISQIITNAKDGRAVDFQNLIRYSTLNIATDLLFGTCVRCLPYPTDASPNIRLPFLPATEFSDALLRLQEIVSERERLGWLWPLYELHRDKAAEPLKVISRNLDPIVQWALGRKMMMSAGVTYHSTHCHSADDGKETLLDHLVELTSEPNLVQSAILNTLIVGRVGTATTLTQIIYFLAQYPTIMHRLRQEILDIVGTTGIPDGEDILAMKYLRAVINETLRLAPQIHYITRESVAATTWPSPNPSDKQIYIPANVVLSNLGSLLIFCTNCRILIDTGVLHTSKDLWGPDAGVFDPNRFLDHRYDRYLALHPYIFLPFGSGPRTCVGKDFPYDELSVTVIELLRRFDKITLSAAGLSFETRAC